MLRMLVHESIWDALAYISSQQEQQVEFLKMKEKYHQLKL